MGNLPKFGDNSIETLEEGTDWLIPTAEVPVTKISTAMRSLKRGNCPSDHVAFDTCFRCEKVSAGKDVRGSSAFH